MANLTINYSKNPDLKEIFSRWEVGKSYKVEIDFQLMSMDEEGAEGAINEVGVEDGTDGEPAEVTPDSKEPVVIVLMAQKDGAGKKGKMPDKKESAMSGKMAGY